MLLHDAKDSMLNSSGIRNIEGFRGCRTLLGGAVEPVGGTRTPETEPLLDSFTLRCG